MRFAVTDEQRALRDSVRSLLSRKSDSAAVRAAIASPTGYDAGLWATLCTEIGVAGLAIPERFGGLDASIRETCVVAEELGRTLTPAPLLGSAVLAAQAILATGDEDACDRLLPSIAEGRLATLAWVDRSGHWNPERSAYAAARGTGADWTIGGTAHYVLDADLADLLLVVARTEEGVGLFEVDPEQPSVHRKPAVGMDLTRRLGTVQLTGARGSRIGTDARSALGRARDVGCVVLAAEQVGAAARCLELTVEYTKARVQFGRPIGGFQALKHRMADLYVQVETARSAAAAAALADAEELPARAAVAKAYCSETFSQVAGEMIQLHGGIAITWEHDAHLYFKRAHGSAQLFGQPTEHLARLSTTLTS